MTTISDTNTESAQWLMWQATMITTVVAVCCAAIKSSHLIHSSRKHVMKPKRLHWRHHVQRKLHEGKFHEAYKMEYESFKKLLSLIRGKLEVLKKVFYIN